MSSDFKIILSVGIATLVLIGAAIFFFGGSSQTSSPVADQKILIRSDSEKISSSSAKVTIVEFGDYQCPACGAAEPVVEQILKDYKGKINFVFRNFAFIGQESTWAAEGAECAGKQGKFWQYHDYLYSHQGGENKGAFSKDNLKNFAKTLGLDSKVFNSCLDSDKYVSKVQEDYSDGQTLGINSTPTFFISKSLKGTLINGEKQVGVPSYSDFKSKIDSLLRK